jgi:hypothetical protein
VKDTYRLSDRLARRKLLLSSGMTLAVLMYMSVTWYREGAGYSTVFATILVLALGIFFFGRNYRQAVSSAASHTLALANDAVLIYVDMDRLIVSLSDRLPRDRVKDSRAHV